MEDKGSGENTLVDTLQAKKGFIGKYKSLEESQRELESTLEELKKEVEEKDRELDKQKEHTRKVETDAKQTVIQTMEDEFTCVICQELLLDATTLPCAHSFCELCLRLWLKNEKKCPVCRRKLKVKAFRSVVLDSAIEKMIEAMDEDTKQKRLELKRERDEQKRVEDATADPGRIREMIHRAEDNDGVEERDNSRNHGGRNGRIRDESRRSSRSRSPRVPQMRYQPYYGYRFIHQNYGGNSSTSSGPSRGYHGSESENATQLTNYVSNRGFYAGGTPTQNIHYRLHQDYRVNNNLVSSNISSGPSSGFQQTQGQNTAQSFNQLARYNNQNYYTGRHVRH